MVRKIQSPGGAAEGRGPNLVIPRNSFVKDVAGLSFVPAGLFAIAAGIPTLETVGYFLASLRDFRVLPQCPARPDPTL